MSTAQRRTRPSGWWFLLCPAFIVAGIAVGVAAGIGEARDISDSFELLGDDGSGTVELDAGDDPTVWAVWDDGRTSDDLDRPRATVAITAPDGSPVAFDARDGSSETTFAFGSDAGIDLGTFDAPVAGRYRVEVALDPAGAAPTAPAVGTGTPTDAATGASAALPTAAVGELDVSRTVARILRPMGLGALAALVAFVVLLVARSRSGRRPDPPPWDPTVRTSTAAADGSTTRPGSPGSSGPITFN